MLYHYYILISFPRCSSIFRIFPMDFSDGHEALAAGGRPGATACVDCAALGGGQRIFWGLRTVG